MSAVNFPTSLDTVDPAPHSDANPAIFAIEKAIGTGPQFRVNGADLTGATDSTAAVQAACTAAAANPTGGTVLFPAGTILVTTPITITNPTPATTNPVVILRGMGSGATTLKVGTVGGAGANAILFKWASTSGNCEKMTIDLNNTAASAIAMIPSLIGENLYTAGTITMAAGAQPTVQVAQANFFTGAVAGNPICVNKAGSAVQGINGGYTSTITAISTTSLTNDTATCSGPAAANPGSATNVRWGTGTVSVDHGFDDLIVKNCGASGTHAPVNISEGTQSVGLAGVLAGGSGDGYGGGGVAPIFSQFQINHVKFGTLTLLNCAQTPQEPLNITSTRSVKGQELTIENCVRQGMNIFSVDRAQIAKIHINGATTCTSNSGTFGGNDGAASVCYVDEYIIEDPSGVAQPILIYAKEVHIGKFRGPANGRAFFKIGTPSGSCLVEVHDGVNCAYQIITAPVTGIKQVGGTLISTSFNGAGIVNANAGGSGPVDLVGVGINVGANPLIHGTNSPAMDIRVVGGTATYNGTRLDNGTFSATSKFLGCQGINPIGVVSPAVPLSGTAVAAVEYDRTFYVSTVAGTTSCSMAIQSGPTVPFIASTAQVVAVGVPAGKTVTPTYTGTAPTWVVEGE